MNDISRRVYQISLKLIGNKTKYNQKTYSWCIVAGVIINKNLIKNNWNFRGIVQNFFVRILRFPSDVKRCMIMSQRTVSVATGYDGNLTIKYEPLSEFKLLLILGKKLKQCIDWNEH